MVPGHIYVLQNRAYGPYVVKIGLSKRSPDVRAREIYSGATGVPMPFDIAVAYTVGDCKLAEKLVHKRLRAYRLNGRREFFRLSPAVAGAIARETCASINAELGLLPPEQLNFPPAGGPTSLPGTVVDAEADASDGQPIHWLSLSLLRESPVGASTPTEEQIDRARILHMNLKKVTGIEDKAWLESFTRDEEPERELKIWEHIAMAFLTVDGIDIAPDGLKKEAYQLLLARSLSPTDKVLSSATLKHLSPATARSLLERYQLRPRPLVIRRPANAA
ncbi:GIY-YIG nuclease family protein [Ideonella sp. YS5]|uniref:GIY-YIG nuclease family protein n=1 Tax=Ideonella sp. YS5 TaxID=3453714 RepID=UPI003EE8605C